MMNEHASTSGNEMKKAPRIPTGDELFAEIMGPIEPDLLLSEAEREAKYAGENAAENKARLAKYADAIKKYKQDYEKHQTTQTSEVRSFGNSLLKDFEAQDSAKESSQLDSLESQINNL